MGQQVDAVVQIFREGGFLRQQDDGGCAQLLEQPAGHVGVIRTVGTQDAQVIPVHPAQVGDGHGGVDAGVQTHRRPEPLHVRIVRVTGAVHRVVKGIIDHGAAKVAPRCVGHLL